MMCVCVGKVGGWCACLALVLLLVVAGAGPTIGLAQDDPPEQPVQPQAPDPKASAGVPGVVDGDRLQVPVTATAATVAAAEAAAIDVAVRKVMADQLAEAAFSDGGWADAVKAHAVARLTRKTAIPGGVELRLTVEVNESGLRQWAGERGLRARLELPPLSLAGRSLLNGGQASADESLVTATIGEFLQRREVSLVDYETAKQMPGGLSGTAIGQVDVNVNPAAAGMVRTQVSVKCIDPSTAEVLASATGYSGDVAEAQRALAVARAARNAAGQVWLQLVAGAARNARHGTVYTIAIAGVADDAAAKTLDLLNALDPGGRANVQFRDGRISGTLRFRGDLMDLRRQLQDRLSEAGFRMQGLQADGRRLEFTLVAK